ncbi:MAG: helix-turn-helix transcriptional regulator [Candidatus Omnitrophota bacterium]|nr:helix-turn-helix domain-containing protein [Candidatus Omnitrophota bacterium]
MKTNWLWDSQISDNEAKGILKDISHPKFDIYAEKLLSRTNDPKFVFSMIDKITFCKKWPTIKKRIIKDHWLKDKVIFWQTIYTRVKEQLKAEGIKIRISREVKIPSERMEIAKQIKKIRVNKGYSQKDMASRLHVIQQYISKIENGRENLSIDSLVQIANILGRKISIRMK